MSDAQFPSGPWTGFYTYAPNDKHRMDVHLDFAGGCIAVDGNDDVGRFLIRGKFDASSRECSWTKTYPGSHDVNYRGFREGKGIWGTWEIMNFAHGGFHIWPKGEQEGEAESTAAEATAPVDAIATDREVGVPAIPDAHSEPPDKFAQAHHQLAMALVDIQAKLGDQGVCHCQLGQSIACNRELADAYDSNAKLRDGDDAAGKLADGDNSLGWHR